MNSVIVVLYNHLEDVTRPFIEAMISCKSDFQLVLVNNASSDNTKKYLAHLQDQRIVAVNSEKNLGYGGGVNLGLKKATGRNIIIMNNDVVINNKHFIDDIASFLEENPNVVAGPHLVKNNDYTLFRNRHTPYINGWCMFFTRETMNKLKEGKELFDEGFFMYFEDVELSSRAVDRGLELKEYNPGLEHLQSKSTSSGEVNKFLIKSQKYFNAKMTYNFLEKDGRKRIVFYQETYPYIDSDYEGKGVGGSEASLINLSRQFAKAGWLTEIYNNTTVSGNFNGVEYHHISEFKPHSYADVFVLFRSPLSVLPMVNASTKIFWSCDQWTHGNWRREVFPYVDKVVAISPYHSEYLQSVYGKLEKMVVIDLGVNTKEYENPVKIKNKLIYCSVPGRGLEHLAKIFPRIKLAFPDAELVITSDYRLWGLDRPENEGFYQLLANLDGVKFLGKVSREELVKHQREAEILAYPCTYPECFCISAMECISAGAVPVTTKIGSLATTVGDRGILLEGNPDTEGYQEEFVSEVIKLLTNRQQLEKLREYGQKESKKYDWNNIYLQWIDLINKGGDNMVCKECKKKFKTSYLLSKHTTKEHLSEIELEIEAQAINGPKTQLLKFSQSVEVSINGHRWEGKEIEVEIDYVPSVLEIIRGAYGDVLII